MSTAIVRTPKACIPSRSARYSAKLRALLVSALQFSLSDYLSNVLESLPTIAVRIVCYAKMVLLMTMLFPPTENTLRRGNSVRKVMLLDRIGRTLCFAARFRQSCLPHS
jgi:hypothetical protein